MDRFVTNAGTMTSGGRSEATKDNVPLKNVTAFTAPSLAGGNDS